ncbi:MAG: TlpA family protein disulfide reductase [Candidatus Acidulodesulfobacterium acidiphilum]|uniref:TlpA family protein disulfide reductase n=1 Tax=Candidatus Acidulodesulfobacterium acidiphilum TaxID=2597224 RepID=A0A520XFG3_9DELT|nr:MAG: TlpA family protein disulfide reductase [Candidatus Acidulodesulfobacterium acidiphilum]
MKILLLVFTVVLIGFGGNCFAYTPVAPNISGKVLNSADSGYKKISLKNIKNKIVILNFWATWCPPCRAEIPTLNDFYSSHKKDVLILGVNMNETSYGVSSFLKNYDVAYPIVMGNLIEAEEYGGLGMIPQTFFIVDDRIVFHWSGELNKGILKAVTDKIISIKN